MVDITTIIEALITLAVALVTAFFIPWLKSKVEAEKLSEAVKWVKIAVQAAEMIYTEADMGKFKKNYVLTFLEEKGYTYDVNSIDAMIESAVLELKAEGSEIQVIKLLDEGIDDGGY